MLVAVIMIFVVLSFTGVAVLDVSYNSRTASLETVDNIKVQYALESEINESLWLINSGEDSLVNEEEDGIITNWDPETEVLTISIDSLGVLTEVNLDLSEDTHFERGLASISNIESNGYSYSTSSTHSSRKFKFMPDVDLQYFIDNAVKIHNGNERSWNKDSLSTEGIHIFTGNNLNVTDINLNNSTLVFTGRNITFSGNTVKAPVPGESEDALPALLVTDSDVVFTVSSANHVEGAVYCAGELKLENATLTGPVVGELISLLDDVEFIDSDYDDYYRWTAGFGDIDSYDWPKQVSRWTTTKWGKSS